MRRRARHVLAGDAHRAGGDAAEACDRVDQLGLTVPVDPGEADDLARANAERDAAHLLDPAVVVDAEIRDLEERLRRLRRRLRDAQQDLSADHEAREALLRRALRGQRLDQLAAAEHRDPVGDLEHLVELVRDEDDRLAARRQLSHDLEELLCLLRREHGGGLVQDEDVGVAIERLEDLDALLLADRDVLDAGARIDGEAVAVGDLLDAPLRLPHVEEHALARRLLGEDDVLGHRHHRDEHEVLVHHAHPGVDRRARRPQPHRASLDEDLALVRVVQPVEDVHQGGLARAVLSEERVHLPLAQVEPDVVVRDDPREPLRDVPHLEDLRTGGHVRGIISVRGAASAEHEPAYFRGMSISPSAICAETASSSAISASRSGASGLTSP